jgi:DegV family protein with EDD domain
MAKVNVVADSSCCLPPELAQRFGILLASNGVVINKIVYRDQIDITTSDFWKIFEGSTETITTNAVSPGDFFDIFTRLSKTSDGIACITLSQKLSGTFNSAVQAKEMASSTLPNLKIEIIDSMTSIGALSFIILEAARLAQAGGNLDEVVSAAKNIIPRAKYLLVLETAKYIMRIGRAPAEAKKLEEQSHFSPIMGVVRNTGLVDMLGKEADTMAAQRKAVEMIKNYADVNKPLHVMLHYSRNKSEVRELEKMISSQYKCEEIYISEFSPVVVAALGPSVGLAFYS